MPVNEDLESLSPEILRGKEEWTTTSGRVWTIHHYTMADSTNDICRSLPPWHAVRADTQSRGRGRFGGVLFRTQVGFGYPPHFQPLLPVRSGTDFPCAWGLRY